MRFVFWLCLAITSLSSKDAFAQAGTRALYFTGEGGGGSTGGFAGLTNSLVAAGATGVDTNSTTLAGANLADYRLVFLFVNTSLSAGSVTALQAFYTAGGTVIAVADGTGFKDATTAMNSVSNALGHGTMFTNTALDALCSKSANASGTHPLNAGAPTLRYAYGSDVNGGTLVYQGVSMDVVRVSGQFVAVGDMNALSEDCEASDASNLQFYKNLWTLAAHCGNNAVDAGYGEQCDDGNVSNTDACTTACKTATCGDGFIRANVEQCDDANQVQTDDCLTTCVLAKCGDGVIRAGVEVCDDANQVNSDMCLTTCKPASCGDTYVQDGVEQCDDGNLMNNDDCLTTCVSATCGDGFVNTGSEMCDDGNQIEADACRNNCSPPSCGDGLVSPGLEDCDGGGESASCNDNCTTPKCGDGIVNEAAGEDCDGGANCTDECLSAEAAASGCCDAGGTTPGQAAIWLLVAIVALRRRSRR